MSVYCVNTISPAKMNAGHLEEQGHEMFHGMPLYCLRGKNKAFTSEGDTLRDCSLLRGHTERGIVDMEKLEGTESNKCLFSQAALALNGEHWILLLCCKMMGSVCAS